MKKAHKTKYRIRRTLFFLVSTLLIAELLNHFLPVQRTGSVNYANSINWVYAQKNKADTDIDVFYIPGTVYAGERYNWNNFYDFTRIQYTLAVNADKGIYDDNARFFAPLYHQASFAALESDENQAISALSTGYAEIRDAFIYYLTNYNQGRPFIIAGYSQGAMMCLQLVKELTAYPELMDKLVACYVIGWRVTQEDLDAYPGLKMATGETDTGVIISFNTEAPATTESIYVPSGVKSLSINPLNWQTDSTFADKSLNQGSCKIGFFGNIFGEVQHLTGAYIDSERGTLKAPDLVGSDFEKQTGLTDVYHGYDTQLFYRNLEENVQKRIDAYMQEHSTA